MTAGTFITFVTPSNSRNNIVSVLTIRPAHSLFFETGSIISPRIVGRPPWTAPDALVRLWLTSAARNRSYNQKRLRTGRHRFGQRRIRRLMRKILRAREEAHERPPLLRHMVANRTLQLRITCLERIEHR